MNNIATYAAVGAALTFLLLFICTALQSADTGVSIRPATVPETAPATAPTNDNCSGTAQVSRLSGDDTLLYKYGYSDIHNRGFLRYLRQAVIVTPSQQTLNLSRPSMTDFSQIGQSALVDRLLGEKRDGFYVECGGGNGERYSNSLFFERSRGWQGLLVEANVHYFRELLSKRRNANTVNACLSPNNRSEQLQFINAIGLGGINDKYLDKRGRAMSAKNSSLLDWVQCYPLTSIILALGNPTVDYFSLDVEGAELLILQTIDWSLIDIGLFTVEYNRHKDILAKLRRFFAALGTYREVRHILQQDVVFAKKNLLLH